MSQIFDQRGFQRGAETKSRRRWSAWVLTWILPLHVIWECSIAAVKIVSSRSGVADDRVCRYEGAEGGEEKE